jgi:hypothetical protein
MSSLLIWSLKNEQWVVATLFIIENLSDTGGSGNLSILYVYLSKFDKCNAAHVDYVL